MKKITQRQIKKIFKIENSPPFTFDSIRIRDCTELEILEKASHFLKTLVTNLEDLTFKDGRLLIKKWKHFKNSGLSGQKYNQI